MSANGDGGEITSRSSKTMPPGTTRGIGEACVKSSNCSTTGYAGGKSSKPSWLVGCCNGKCAFRRNNYTSSWKCMDKCRTCYWCKWGENSDDPCVPSEQEKSFFAKNPQLKQRRPMYPQKRQYSNYRRSGGRPTVPNYYELTSKQNMDGFCNQNHFFFYY